MLKQLLLVGGVPRGPPALPSWDRRPGQGAGRGQVATSGAQQLRGDWRERLEGGRRPGQRLSRSAGQCAWGRRASAQP